MLRNGNSNNLNPFNGKCNNCKKVGHKEADCRKKKFEDQQDRRAAERTEHRLSTPIQIVITDGCLKVQDGVEITLSDVLYIPAFDGNLLSVSELAEKGKRDGIIYKVRTVLREACRRLNGNACSEWELMHTKLGHIRFQRYQNLRTMTERLPAIKSEDTVEEVCEGCCMGKMAVDNLRTSPYAIVFVDDCTRHVSVYFMKKKSEALDKFKIYKSEPENLTDNKIKRHRSDNGGDYTGKRFVDYLSACDIKRE
ncbi:Integrase catalytic core protein, partial [Globisporangium splendens]